ncbi:Delta(12) fatty acid desaturase [Zalerion maritima]|uniref:Delta(12) fatty acid desaturase n=1 Tax=Zalerion maritima TaxID=339359 RepID=A0AAD5RSU3_9PEZI|nr:Delta(12) fatty acid desaturase [Zalerion maritima]
MSTTAMETTTVTTTQANGNGNGAPHITVKAVAQPEFPDVKTIKDAIPAYCFVPSTWRSMGHLAKDFAMAGSFMWAGATYIPQIEDYYLRFAAWCVYGYVQGLLGTGLWILAHECGHGAFSVHPRLNDFVGWFTHSVLSVPFFSWKFSHHRHHNNTGHMKKDMVFVPPTKEQRKASPFNWELVEDVPIVNLLKLIVHQLGGFQLYLLFNVTAGSESVQKKNTSIFRRSHFDAWSSVFRPKEAIFILLSDLGLALTWTAVYFGAQQVGWSNMFLLYVVPYLWVHHWLVAITYLHHTHPDVPHYDENGWSYVKGALATIDRDFGFIGRYVFHGIIETHVVHHLFPRIPFYYADEATEAIAKLLGPLYYRDDRSFIAQLWSTFNTCNYVENDPAQPGTLKWAKKA